MSASPQCEWFGGKHFNIHTGEKLVWALSSVDTASNQIGKVSWGKILKLPLKLQFFQKKIASNPQ